MNPPSDTPRVKAFLKDKPPLWRDWKEVHFVALEVLALELERELTVIKSKREAAVRYGAESLESDSIIGSCNCLEKTPEAYLHKPGCKYRLISERDDARRECERLQGILNTLPDKLAQRLENLWAALGWNFEVLSVAQKAMADEIEEALTNK